MLQAHSSADRPNLDLLHWNIFIWMPDFLAGVLCYRLIGTRARLPWWLFPFALAAITIPYLAHPTVPASWLCCFALAVLLPLFEEMPAGLVFVATTGLGSALPYHLVEAPLIAAGSRVASRRRARAEAIAA
jgi:peptidoglycan/LPS O-acetylase OafA/YrhL